MQDRAHPHARDRARRRPPALLWTRPSPKPATHSIGDTFSGMPVQRLAIMSEWCGSLLDPQLLLMRFHQFIHAVELEVDVRHRTWIHGGPKTLLGVSSIDPA